MAHYDTYTYDFHPTPLTSQESDPYSFWSQTTAVEDFDGQAKALGLLANRQDMNTEPGPVADPSTGFRVTRNNRK